MYLSKSAVFAILAAGTAAFASAGPASAAPFGLKAPAVEANTGVILAAVQRNATASRPVARSSAPRMSAPVQRRLPAQTQVRRQVSQPTRTVSKPQQQVQKFKPQVQKPQQQAQKPKPQVQKPQQQAQKSKPQVQKLQQQAQKPLTTPKTNPAQLAQKSGLAKPVAPKTAAQIKPATQNVPAKLAALPGQSKLGGPAAATAKPQSYQSKLAAPFKSKVPQMGKTGGAGRILPPGLKHNAYMLAGAKGLTNGYRPFWFSNGGSNWYRYYYTAFVGGVAYWYWTNLTAAEVYENRVVLTSYASNDCECDNPPPAPPACDCDDDDCGE
jgi:outer membrane biosynthesis protein TonB